MKISRLMYIPKESQMIKVLNSSSPSDYVYLPDETSIKIRSYWTDIENKQQINVPADLVIAKTIPIKDIVFSTDVLSETKMIGTTCLPKISQYRVCMFEKAGLAKDEADKSVVIVGCITFTMSYTFGSIDFLVPIIFDEPSCCLGVLVVCVQDPILARKELPDQLYEGAKNLAFYMLVDWYSVQIMLLHPQLKTVFNHPTKMKVKDTITRKQTNGRRITKYVKRHAITLDSIDDAMKISDKTINRKTLAWWVIGHYRTYKNGTKKFIQGYWKGPLRSTKRNYDEIRERIIDPNNYKEDK